jgi:hypothetical protein
MTRNKVKLYPKEFQVEDSDWSRNSFKLLHDRKSTLYSIIQCCINVILLYVIE